MERFLIRWVVSTLGIFATAYLLPGAEVNEFSTAIGMALVLGILNATLKPILILFTLPITLFSFGLFLFVINALMILLLDHWFAGFQIAGFGSAVVFSLVLTLVNSLLFRIGEGKQQKP